MVKERAFDVNNLEGYEELVIMLKERGWTHLNSLIKPTNKSIMAILNQYLIDAELLITSNIKLIVDAPQRACGHFCIINELCRLEGVTSHPDDVMISPMVQINKNTIHMLLLIQ